MTENKMIRYMIYGIILVKITAIYDKIKSIVAINNVYYQMIRDERLNMKTIFKDENMMQDMITKKILDSNKYIDDEEELNKGSKRKSTFL